MELARQTSLHIFNEPCDDGNNSRNVHIVIKNQPFYVHLNTPTLLVNDAMLDRVQLNLYFADGMIMIFSFVFFV